MFDSILILLAYVSGSLPFSVWLGNIFLREDIRQYGDGNPGATNVFRSGNNYVGLAALLLDITKAALPVGIAFNILNISGLPMFLIGLAPVLGHIFPLFLRFRGGKALAVSFGTWIGLTVWYVSAPAALAATIGALLFTAAGWAVVLALLVILAVILMWYPDPLLLSTWMAQSILMIWTHRMDLRHAPKFRPWIKKLNIGPTE